LPKVTFGDCANRSSHLGRGPDEIVNQRIDGVHFVGPTTGGAGDRHSLTELSLLADGDRHARRLLRPALAHGDDVVERVCDLPVYSSEVNGQAHREIPLSIGQNCGEELRAECIAVGRDGV
jgi:hypothetical protein